MNKRHLHHFWRKFRVVKPWYFLVIAVVFGMLAVFALRSNYSQMATLRDAVYTADKNNGDVAKALNNLRSYVYGHMNTNLSSGTDIYPPIQLKYTYDRLIQAQSAMVASQNSQIYTDAQHYCEQLYPDSFSGGPRVPCITQYVSSHGSKAQPIPDALYKFNFVSPSWSPDLAGWSIVVTALAALITVGLFMTQWWLKRYVS